MYVKKRRGQEYDCAQEGEPATSKCERKRERTREKEKIQDFGQPLAEKDDCRVAKTHRIPQVAGLFPQKSRELLVSFAENDL